MSPDPITPPVTLAAMKAQDALQSIAVLATDAASPITPSPPASFKGWVFGVWIRKNKEKLKNIITFASGLATAWIGVHLIGNLGLLAGGVVGLLTSFVLDGIDFFFTKDPA